MIRPAGWILAGLVGVLTVSLQGGAAAGPSLLRTTPEEIVIGPFSVPLPRVDDWGTHLKVTVAGGTDLPPVAGKVHQDERLLRFVPAFPFTSRSIYTLEFDHPKLGRLKQDFAPEPPREAAGPRAEVVAVYPSGDVLPQNLLRFYIQFSSPMSRGEAFRHIRLRDAEGATVEEPFLELAEELWDAEGTRFTLFLDPGRVKRGLKPHMEAGPPLTTGQRYRLEIDAGWKDAQRRTLAGPFRKEFRTGEPDYDQPDPAGWKIVPPPSGTRQALVVTFDGPLDHELARRLISVRPAGKKLRLEGTITMEQGETCWRFTPGGPWKPGDYQLVVATELEDPAGNSIRKPFESNPDRPDPLLVLPTERRSFTIAP